MTVDEQVRDRNSLGLCGNVQCRQGEGYQPAKIQVRTGGRPRRYCCAACRQAVKRARQFEADANRRAELRDAARAELAAAYAVAGEHARKLCKAFDWRLTDEECVSLARALRACREHAYTDSGRQERMFVQGVS